MNTASILIHSLGWSLVHSLWQGALVFAALRLVLFLSPGMSARLKYHCSLASLLALFSWFTVTCIQEWQKLQIILVKVTEGAGIANKEYFITAPAAPAAATYSQLFQQLEQFFPVIIMAYAAGVFLFSVRIMVNLVQVHSWQRTGIQQPAAGLMDMLERMKAKLELDQRIKLFVSEKILVPVMFGILKPVILLPVSAVARLSPDQLEAILVHELAHIKRNDYLVNILQTIAETILFFNPFTWMISSIIRREREHCCDDLVLSYTAQPLPYAKALAALEDFRLQPGMPALAAGGNKTHLLNRIKRIMEMKKQSLQNSHVLVAVMLVVALGISVVCLTPAVAQNKKPAKTEQSVQQQTHISVTADDDGGVVVDSNGVKKKYRKLEEVPERIAEAVTPQAMEAAEDAMTIAQEVIDEVDVAAIVQDAMSSINWEEIGTELNNAMQQVNKEVEQAVKDAGRQLNDPKTQKQIREEMTMAKKEVRAALAQVKKDAAAAKKEMQADAAQQRKERVEEEAAERAEQRKEAAEDRKEKLQGRKEAPGADAVAQGGPQVAVAQGGRSAGNNDRVQGMLQQMERDGLINRAQGYNIVKSGSTLLINGKVQGADVLKKYGDDLNGDDIIIKGKEEQTSIIRD